MNEKDYEIANKILETLSSGVKHTVSDYSIWFIADAIVWIILSLIAIGIAIYILNKIDEIGFRIAAWVVIFIFACIIGEQVPDLIASQAKAVHQLIKDIKS